MKSTKIIAGLGVAAALGVAALPVATFAETAATHTVKASANVAGTITVKVATGTNPDPTEIAANGTINFGNLAGGDMLVHGDTTVVDVETNYPNGYGLNANATALTHETGEATIGLASAATFTGDATTKGSYTGKTSAWGIKVAKATYNYASSNWSTTAGSLSSGSNYSTENFNAVADGTIDETGAISTKTRNKYTMSYGIGITANQASGAYSGDIVYTVTATDYTAPSGD